MSKIVIEGAQNTFGKKMPNVFINRINISYNEYGRTESGTDTPETDFTPNLEFKIYKTRTFSSRHSQRIY